VMAKEGSTVSGLMDAFATSISLAFQYGVPLETLVDKFAHVRFEPSGFTQNSAIPMAKSITDYIFRWLASKFGSPELQERVGIHKPEPVEGETQKALPAAKVVASTSEPVIHDAKPVSDIGATFKAQTDAPSCHYCGSIMTRNGACYRCANCGSTSGCS